jgi:hypothetical protein
MEPSKDSLNNLFGWKNIVDKTPAKVASKDSCDHLFKTINNQNQQIAVCYDGSGSTLFNNRASFDGKIFAEIYTEALFKLQADLPSHEIICWSSAANRLDVAETEKFKELIQNKIPFANAIQNMNQGTDPQKILEFVKDKTTIIITDGEIQPKATMEIQSKIQTSGIGSVFLIIVPHIDSYPNLYLNANIETSAMDSIRLSIPQAFSGRLATVIVWNYKKQMYEIIPELTAPWVNKSETLKEILNKKLPIGPPGEFMIEQNGHYKSFALDKLIAWLSENNIDETMIEKLESMGVKAAIRQQGSENQRNDWNRCIETIFHKILSLKVKNDFKEIPVPDGTSMMERIKITSKNEHERRKIETIHRHKLGEICGKLLIDKSLAEMKTVGAAKASQTIANVSAFQKMKQEDKLSEIVPALIVADCGICTTHTQCYKTVSLPTKLIVQFGLCRIEKEIMKKKNKKETLVSLNVEAMKEALSTYPARFHFMNLCSDCANITLKNAKHPTDPEYGISNLIPQNQSVNAAGVVSLNERLILFPFIAAEHISDTSNPNDPKLSFARQWLRGYLSQVIGLDPAGQECLTACLMFLSSLSNNKENAQVVYPNIVSLLRGGRNDRFAESIGRLFSPSTKKISAEILTIISIVEETIEMAEMPILPESNKLLLLCLLDRKVSILINAKNQKERATHKLNMILDEVRAKLNSKEKEKFGMTELMISEIEKSENNQQYMEQNSETYNQLIGTYLQNTMGLNLQSMVYHEATLMKVLQATDIKDMAHGLNMNENHLMKMIERSKMSTEEFMTMTPNFIKGLVNVSPNNKMNVMMQFV